MRNRPGKQVRVRACGTKPGCCWIVDLRGSPVWAVQDWHKAMAFANRCAAENRDGHRW